MHHFSHFEFEAYLPTYLPALTKLQASLLRYPEIIVIRLRKNRQILFFYSARLPT